MEMRFILRILSSTALGLVVLALLVVLLGALSVLAQTHPGLVRSIAGRAPADVYSHPVLLALWVLLALNVLLATVVRIRLSWVSLGAWVSHLGVLVLAAGATAYTMGVVHGQAVSLLGPGGWSDVGEFYLDDTLAVALLDESGEVVSQPLPHDGGTWSMSAGDATLRLVEFWPYGAADWSLMESELDTAPPAAVLEVGGQLLRLGPRATAIETPQLLLMLMGDLSSEELADMLAPDAPLPDIDKPLLLVLPQERGWRLAIVADGQTELLPLEQGRTVQLRLPAPPVDDADAPTTQPAVLQFDLTPRQLLRQAQLEPVPAKPHQAGDPVAAVEVVAGERAARFWLRYAPFLSPDAWDVVTIGGRTMGVALTRQRRRLPATVSVQDVQYQTWQGSGTVRDFVTTVAVQSADRSRQEVIRLNEPLSVGPYRLSHGAWLPRPQEPDAIVFTVATRPGLWVVWLGCGLIVAGMLWAFYVKPVVLRRRSAT
jgi:hypothetical protein